MHIIVETERLYLRRFTEADAPLVRQLSNAPGVLQYIPEPQLASDEEARQVLVNIILPQYEKGLGRWAAHVKVTDEFIGWCGLKWLSENDEIDLGYRFIPSAWGKGYATESAAAVLQYGHEQLKLSKLIAHAHIDNIASQKVLEKIGMQYIGEGEDGGLPVKGYVSFSNKL